MQCTIRVPLIANACLFVEKNIESRSARVQIHFEQIIYMDETATVCV